jgi:hypothetical protein
MKKAIMMLMLVILSTLLLTGHVYAREGICGYEGGISSGEVPDNSSYDYKEVTFISGEPVVFEGHFSSKRARSRTS